MKEITNDDLVGLMGSCEMECALAAMINASRRCNKALKELAFCADQFSDEGYERDGFTELLEYGWLDETKEPESYKLSTNLLNRIAKTVRVLKKRDSR